MKKDTLKKLTVRVYDSKVVERLDDLWNKHSRLYSAQNTFLCDLLLRGIESVENELSNVKEMQRDGNIFKEMKRLTSLLDRFVDVGYEHYKESFVIGKENQGLMSRLYDVIFRMAKEHGISVENYNDGTYDALPDGFEDVTDALIEEFHERENN